MLHFDSVQDYAILKHRTTWHYVVNISVCLESSMFPVWPHAQAFHL
jgi:hypothetical protein